MTPVGIAVVLPTLIKEAGSKGLIGALQAVESTNLIIAGISLAATVAAIGVSFISSRYYHSAMINQSEMNSLHTAKYMVKELKKAAPLHEEYPENCRKDGQLWVNFTTQTNTVTHNRAHP